MFKDKINAWKSLPAQEKSSLIMAISSLIMTVATIVLVIVTVAYAYFTYEMTSFTKETFKHEIRPYIMFNNLTPFIPCVNIKTGKPATELRLHLINVGKTIGYFQVVNMNVTINDKLLEPPQDVPRIINSIFPSQQSCYDYLSPTVIDLSNFTKPVPGSGGCKYKLTKPIYGVCEYTLKYGGAPKDLPYKSHKKFQFFMQVDGKIDWTFIEDTET